MAAAVLIMLMALALDTAQAQPCSSGEAARRGMIEHAQAALGADASIGLVVTAASGDLGFTLFDPRRLDAGSGGLSVWMRGGDCAWAQAFAVQLAAEPLESAANEPSGAQSLPERDLTTAPPPAVGREAGPRAIEEFERVATDDGVAMALHIYALDAGFLLLLSPSMRAELYPADLYLTVHPWRGVWRDTRRESSVDGTMLVVPGELIDARGLARRRYLQIWQYDPKVANWGLRVLWSSEAAE